MMNPKIGDTVILFGKSHKGKNRIREHGEKWEVVEIRLAVPCLNGSVGLFLHSKSGTDYRWIKWENDEDFEIVK